MAHPRVEGACMFRSRVNCLSVVATLLVPMITVASAQVTTPDVSKELRRHGRCWRRHFQVRPKDL